MHKFFTILLSAFFVSFGNAQSDSTFSISGRVISIERDSSIVRGVLIVSGKQKRHSANITSGRFNVGGLTKGYYTLQWSCVGYLPQDTVIAITDHNIENIAWLIIAKLNGKSLNDIVADHIHAPSYNLRSKQLDSFNKPQTFQREQNERAEAFAKRLLNVNELAHPVIETAEWDTAKKVILVFAMHRVPVDTILYNEEIIVGYAFIPVTNNIYRRVLIDTFYEDGGPPHIEAVFFVNTDKDKQRELAVIVSTTQRHRGAGVYGDFYNTFFYDNPNLQLPPERFTRFKELSEKFNCFEGDIRDKSEKCKYKDAAVIRAALKRMAY